MAQQDAPDVDRIEVWVCRIPAETAEPVYAGLPLRLPLTPEGIVSRAGPRLAEYFDELSHGRYEVVLIAGGSVTIGPTETPTDCADQALDASGPDATLVLAVADAEHVATAPGGWGRPGSRATCVTDCTARATRRAIYLGASDFHPDWGPIPALDLLEHEIGHTLDLPHSGDVTSGESGHTSALDVMSNSAAPRDVDPKRLDGPGTLAVNRLALGWLPVEAVATVEPASVASGGDASGTTVRLLPSASTDGVRLLVLPVDEHRVLTIELLAADGYDDHLPADGIAVHLVDDGDGTGLERRQQTLGSIAPHSDLLTAGESLTAEGWQITVRRVGDEENGLSAEVAVTPTDR